MTNVFSLRLLGELSITWLDLVALGFLIATWIGYAIFADWRGKSVPNLHSQMDGFRREWMVRMMERDNPKACPICTARWTGSAASGWCA
jgi:hypothetical protein